MKRLPRFLAFFGLVVVVAAVSAGFCMLISSHMQSSAMRERAHDWVHQQLGLSEQQKQALEPSERQYAADRARLEHNLHMANVALADAIETDKQDSENVHRAIEEIHARMGELQKLTIAHIFEMKKVLTSEQYAKLLRLTADALRESDDSSHDDGHE